ncbi:MAG: inositol monophosphatase family protein [Planctomycetota bacterium]
MMNEYLRFARVLARRAGQLIHSLEGRCSAKTKSTELDLVTKADKLSEKLIISAIRKRFPTHQILAEEATGINLKSVICNLKSDMLWVIDPLDGTTNFSHSFPFYCVSIALVQGETSIVGAVYNPALDELFSAAKGKGAWLGNKRIKVSKVKRLTNGMLCTGFPYIIRQKPGDNFRNFQRFCLTAQAVRRAGAAALDLCYLAMGRIDGFWERELKPWDTAAGALIVQEAGGKVSDFKGGPFRLFGKREILASNGLIHNEMVRVINRG